MSVVVVLCAVLAASLGVNLALWWERDGAPPQHCQLHALNKTKMDLHTTRQHQRFAEHALEQAAAFSGKTGGGQFGWLNLLKAFDYDPHNLDVAENLVSNYKQLEGYDPVALSLLAEHNLTRLLPGHDKVAHNAKRLEKIWRAHDPGPSPCTTVGFATAVSQWDLEFTPALHQQVYSTAVDMYHSLRSRQPNLTATQLNHELWKVQREGLDRTGSFWGRFQHLPGFTDLVSTMRAASFRFLNQTYGVRLAEYKAAHPMVVWVSVHTSQSQHEPHVTMDAMVGGVYYVHVPANAGRLELYDPRGKSPLTLVEPESPALPPFHRTIGIQPRSGKLVLFPGWLVHSVLQPEQPSPPATDVEYRVSLSLNLKGEWQTTAGLSMGCETFVEDK
ncbi:hypothetical protein BASA81_006693 [Batrachochytrium salamandrivorans]|nr:hypothetical protein BASA81_006693 [Batrachochytrium salamandrivorans]